VSNKADDGAGRKQAPARDPRRAVRRRDADQPATGKAGGAGTNAAPRRAGGGKLAILRSLPTLIRLLRPKALPDDKLPHARFSATAFGIRSLVVAGSGSPTVVFESGIGQGKRNWAPVFNRVSELTRAVAYDRAGYGQSETSDLPRDGLQLVLELRDLLRTEGLGPPYVLVGHSLGGALSLRTALDVGDRLEGVVLVAPAIDVSETRSPLLPIRVWQRIAESILVFVPATASPFGVETKDPDDEPYPYRTPFTPRRVIAQTIGLIDRNAADSDKLDVPLMVAVVPDDVVVDPVATERWYERVEAPRKVRFEANRSAHPLPRDLDAPDLCRAIDEFVRSLE